VAELSGKPCGAAINLPVDYQARADACTERDKEDVPTPACGSDLKLAVSSRVRVIIYDHGKVGYSGQLRDNVYLGKAGEVGHNLYAIRPAINKTGDAYAYASRMSACAAVITQCAGGLHYLSKQRVGVLLLALYANFVKYLSGGAYERALERSSAEI